MKKTNAIEIGEMVTKKLVALVCHAEEQAQNQPRLAGVWSRIQLDGLKVLAKRFPHVADRADQRPRRIEIVACVQDPDTGEVVPIRPRD